MHVITLLGEQPIPSLVVLRYLKPDSFTIISTEFTAHRAARLMDLVPAERKESLKIPPYEMQKAQELIRKHVDELSMRADELAFDLTGGTKIMALAGYAVAQALRAPVFYLRTQQESVLFRYSFGEAGVVESEEILPLDERTKQLINLEDYLRAYLGDFKISGPCDSEPGRSFEIAVQDVLSRACDEVVLGIKAGGALDIDLAVRVGNRVGVAELKTGSKAEKKRPLEQLNSACGRAFLGIYTRKFLIIDRKLEAQNLKDLAEAWRIKVIELPGFAQNGRLTVEDQEKLIKEVRTALES